MTLSESKEGLDQDVEIVVVPDMSLPQLYDEARKQTNSEPEAKKLADAMLRTKLQEIVTHERNVYGRSYKEQGNFGEYVACQEPECRRVEDAETIHPELIQNPGLTLEELEQEKGLDFGRCPDCGTEYGLIFDPEVFWAYLREYFRRKVINVDGQEKEVTVAQTLMIGPKGPDARIQGNTIAYPHNAQHAFSENINYRNSYDWAEISLKLADKMGVPVEEVAKQIVVIWNRIAFSRDYRKIGSGYFNTMVSSVLQLFSEYDDRPMIGDTRLDSRLWPLLSAIGYEEVARDEHGWVLIYLETQMQLRQALALSRDEFKEEYGERLQEAREVQQDYVAHRDKESQLYIAEHGHTKPRHFRGAVLVNDFREALLGDEA